MSDIIDKLLETRARRAAQRLGFVARKSRVRRISINNRGGFRIFNPRTNFVVSGERYDLTAQHVIEFCAEYEEKGA